MRRVLACCLATAAVTWLACAKHDDAVAGAPDGGDDEDVDAGPSWLGDAGLLERAPVQQPLHALCGIASNPGDMPLGDDAPSAALRKGYFDAAVDLGGVRIRRDFRWSEIEPSRGQLVWDRYDALVDEAATRSVALLGTLGYGVTWANAQAKDEYWPPSDPGDFASWAGQVAQRYHGRVAAWEIWNEPNNGFRFWKDTLSGDPAAYATLLARASDAIHGAAPDATVLLGGTVFTPELITGAIPWLEQAYAASPELARSFDVAGIHTYAQYPPERAPEIGELFDPPIEQKLQMHAWLLAQHGGDAKPLWITELGWPVYASVDLAQQARFTTRATILAARAGASGIFWYTLRDGPHPEAFPPEDAFGLLAHDGTPKPVYVALKTLLHVVGERWATTAPAPLDGLPADARAVVFHGASGADVVAAWTVTTPSANAVTRAAGDLADQGGATRGAVDAGASFALTPDVTYLTLR